MQSNYVDHHINVATDLSTIHITNYNSHSHVNEDTTIKTQNTLIILASYPIYLQSAFFIVI